MTVRFTHSTKTRPVSQHDQALLTGRNLKPALTRSARRGQTAFLSYRADRRLGQQVPNSKIQVG